METAEPKVGDLWELRGETVRLTAVQHGEVIAYMKRTGAGTFERGGTIDYETFMRHATKISS